MLIVKRILLSCCSYRNNKNIISPIYECDICLEDKILVKFPSCYNHKFCKKCISNWKYKCKNSIYCPICRK